jgi:hypothetical protein
MKYALVLIYLLFIPFVLSQFNQVEQRLIVEWLSNVVHPLDTSFGSPCDWGGIAYEGDDPIYFFVCDTLRTSVISINTYSHNASVAKQAFTKMIMYGALPDVPTWIQAYQNGSAFAKLIELDFQEYRTHPFMPDWVSQISGNPDPLINPFNFIFTNQITTSLMCLSQSQSSTGLNPNFLWTKEKNIMCTNFNIIELFPSGGSSSGGTEVYVKINAPIGHKQIFCSFGSETDGLTPRIPISELYFQTYYSQEYNNTGNDEGQVGMVFTILKCLSPPHPPGQVLFRIFAGNTNLTITQDFYFDYECPPGTELNFTTSACQVCRAGTWSPGEKIPCLPCPKGSYTLKASKNTFCTLCPKGKYGIDIAANSSDTCLSCPPGFAGVIEGADKCLPCNRGYFSNSFGATACSSCRPGTFQSSFGNETCPQCPIGKWNNENNSYSCYDCPIGYYNILPGRTSCIPCKAGFSTKFGSNICEACNPGFYRPDSFPACLPCVPGRFSNISGSVICQLCEVGFWNSQLNSTRCYRCPDGTLTVNQGSTSCYVLKSPPVYQENLVPLIIGIIFIIITIIILIGVGIYFIIKKREQAKRKAEVAAIKAIMDEVA